VGAGSVALKAFEAPQKRFSPPTANSRMLLLTLRRTGGSGYVSEATTRGPYDEQ
jgi:hypothetical protein